MRKSHVLTAVLALSGAGVLVASPAGATPDTFNCEDFTSQAQAQAKYDADPSDPHGLDGPVGAGFDGKEGVACEALPGPSAAPRAPAAEEPPPGPVTRQDGPPPGAPTGGPPDGPPPGKGAPPGWTPPQGTPDQRADFFAALEAKGGLSTGTEEQAWEYGQRVCGALSAGALPAGFAQGLTHTFDITLDDVSLLMEITPPITCPQHTGVTLDSPAAVPTETGDNDGVIPDPRAGVDTGGFDVRAS
jgi:hypothetical protein